eukprot:4442258-Alexandrium_andersonii.AAC.1
MTPGYVGEQEEHAGSEAKGSTPARRGASLLIPKLAAKIATKGPSAWRVLPRKPGPTKDAQSVPRALKEKLSLIHI